MLDEESMKCVGCCVGHNIVQEMVCNVSGDTFIDNAEAPRHPEDMCVDRNDRPSQSKQKHASSGLEPHTGEFHEILKCSIILQILEEVEPDSAPLTKDRPENGFDPRSLDSGQSA
jgi:hypothetical protein